MRIFRIYEDEEIDFKDDFSEIFQKNIPKQIIEE